MKFPADHRGLHVGGLCFLEEDTDQLGVTCWGITSPMRQLSAGTQAQHLLPLRSGSVTAVPAGASRQALTSWPPSTTCCLEDSHPLACPPCHPTSCQTLPIPPPPSPKVSVCAQSCCSDPETPGHSGLKSKSSSRPSTLPGQPWTTEIPLKEGNALGTVLLVAPKMPHSPNQGDA